MRIIYIIGLILGCNVLSLTAVEEEPMDLSKEAEKYKSCNGKTLEYQSYLTKGIVAFAFCTSYKRFTCKGTCIAYYYDNEQYMNKETSKFNQELAQPFVDDFKKKNPQLSHEADLLFTAAKDCDNWDLGGNQYKKPTSDDDICKQADILKECLLKAHKKVCIDPLAVVAKDESDPDFL